MKKRFRYVDLLAYGDHRRVRIVYKYLKVGYKIELLDLFRELFRECPGLSWRSRHSGGKSKISGKRTKTVQVHGAYFNVLAVKVGCERSICFAYSLFSAKVCFFHLFLFILFPSSSVNTPLWFSLNKYVLVLCLFLSLLWLLHHKAHYNSLAIL